jgi:demethylmenaquinone methyltransferase/2-methoxy-6-polyprenyl-1,4-benzoquinol methylase
MIGIRALECQPPASRESYSWDFGRQVRGRDATPRYTPLAMPATPALPLDKDAPRIREMFGRVAPRYDLLNHLLSASLDHVWRRKLARSLGLPEASSVLDLCSGTGDQSVALAKRRYEVTSADFCLPMLALARPKFRRVEKAPRLLQADALKLPFGDGRFDGATVSFGLRNVADLDQALSEIARVIRPGGTFGALEFTTPVIQPFRGVYLFYFRHLLPLAGRIVSGDAAAYSYLPASVTTFPQREAFLARAEAAGFEAGRFESLSFGILALYLLRRSR